VDDPWRQKLKDSSKHTVRIISMNIHSILLLYFDAIKYIVTFIIIIMSSYTLTEHKNL
jgi:hypothetical protein